MRLWVTLAFVAAAGTALAGPGDTMQSIMARHVNPAALAFWAAGNDPPDGETPAQAQARWAAALKGAAEMQKWGATLQAPPFTRTGVWNSDAQLMIDIARLGEPAIKAQDSAKSFEIGGRLYDACNECHKLYVPRRGATIPRDSPLNKP